MKNIPIKVVDNQKESMKGFTEADKKRMKKEVDHHYDLVAKKGGFVMILSNGDKEDAVTGMAMGFGIKRMNLLVSILNTLTGDMQYDPSEVMLVLGGLKSGGIEVEDKNK